jgi:hypothetical protein
LAELAMWWLLSLERSKETLETEHIWSLASMSCCLESTWSISGTSHDIQSKSRVHNRSCNLESKWLDPFALIPQWLPPGNSQGPLWSLRTLPGFHYRQGDIEEKGTKVYRTLWYTLDTSAINKKVSKSDIDAINCWKSLKKANINRPHHPMWQHCKELELLFGPFLRYTWAM